MKALPRPSCIQDERRARWTAHWILACCQGVSQAQQHHLAVVTVVRGCFLNCACSNAAERQIGIGVRSHTRARSLARRCQHARRVEHCHVCTHHTSCPDCKEDEMRHLPLLCLRFSRTSEVVFEGVFEHQKYLRCILASNLAPPAAF